MNNKIKEDNFKFFENDFSPALFNNDNDLKKKLELSYLNNLIEFTNKKLILNQAASEEAEEV